MPVVADSYMGIFMPADISERITRFMAGKIEFPFVERNEVLAAFYLYGKDYRVASDEVKAATDMAKKTVEQTARDIRLYMTMPQKLDSAFTRENYTKRSLQIAVDAGVDQEINRRIGGDPAILSDCFAQHIAHYKQDYFFELFQPFQRGQLPPALQSKLEGRMLLLGFNAKNRQALSYTSSLEPFFRWMSKV